MAIINKGTAFSNGEQLSASKLNALIDDATFGTESVDNSSTLLNGNGSITVRDSGITAAKLATNSVTTAKILNANVTTAKIADSNVTFAKLTDVIDDDTMATATDTTLATSESIKAYVDSNPFIKAYCTFDTQLSGANPPTTGYNVTSVTRIATGKWEVNLTNPSPLSNFVTLTSASPTGGSANVSSGAYALSNSIIQVELENSNGNGTNGTSPVSVVAIW